MPNFSMPSIGKPNFLKKKDAAYYINRIEELKKELDPVKSQNKKPYIGSIYNNYVKLLNILLADLNNSAKNTSDEYATHLADFVEFIRAYPIIDPAIVVSGKIRDIRTFFPKFYKPANDDLAKYVTAIHEYKNAPQLNIPGVFKNYIKINNIFERFQNMMQEPRLKSLQIYAPLMTALSSIYSADFEDFKNKNAEVLTEQRQVELKKEALDELPKRTKDSTIGVGPTAVAAVAEKPVLTMTQAEMDAVMGAVKQVQGQGQAPVQAQVSIPDKMTLFFDLLKQNKIHYLNIFGSIFYLSKLYKNKNIQPALYNLDKFKEIFHVGDDKLCEVIKAFAPVFGIEKADFKSQASKVDVDLKLGASAEDDALMIEHLSHYRSFLDQRASINAYTKTDNRANEARIAKIDGYIRFLELGLGDRVKAVPGLTCNEADLQKSYIASQAAPAQGSAPAQGKSLTALETVALVQSLLPKSDCGDCKEVTAIQTLLKHMIAKGNKNASKKVSNSVDEFLKGDEKALETLLELLDRTNPRPVIVSEEDAEQKIDERFHTIESSIQKLSTVSPSEESAKIKQIESTIKSIQTDVEKLKGVAEPAVTSEEIEKLKFAIDEIKDEYPNDGDIQDLQQQILELEDDSLVKLKQIATLFDTIKEQKEINDNKMIAFSYTINELAAKVAASEGAEATAKEDVDAKIDELTQQLDELKKSTSEAAATSTQQSQDSKAAQDAIIEGLRGEIASLRASIATLTAQEQTPIVQPDEIRQSIMHILERNYAKKNNIPKDYATKSELDGYAKISDLHTLQDKVGTIDFTNTIEDLRRQIDELNKKKSLDEDSVKSIIDGRVGTIVDEKIQQKLTELGGLNAKYMETQTVIGELNESIDKKQRNIDALRTDMTNLITKTKQGLQVEIGGIDRRTGDRLTSLERKTSQFDSTLKNYDKELAKLASYNTTIGQFSKDLGGLQTTLEEQQRKIDANKAAIDSQYEKLKQSVDSQSTRMDTLETSSIKKDTKIDVIAKQLADKQGEINSLKAEIEQKMRECADCKASIDKRIAELKTELAATQVPVEVEENKEEVATNDKLSEKLKEIKVLSLKEHIDSFYKSIANTKPNFYVDGLLDLFNEKDKIIIKNYIDKVRDNGFNKIRKDGNILPTFKGAIDMVLANPSVYPAGVTQKLDRIIFGLFKIFVEYVTIVDDKNETRVLTDKEKKESVFNALVDAIGNPNLRKIFHKNTINEVKDVLVSNLEPYKTLSGKVIPAPKILTTETTEEETRLRLTLPTLTTQNPYSRIGRGGALNRTIDDVVFELLARIQTEPSMSEAAIDEMLMEYGVDVDADVTAVEKITGALNFMRELYDI